MSDSFDIYTIIFLGLAVFVFIRLRAVLGTRTGHEPPPSEAYSKRENSPPLSANENHTPASEDVQSETPHLSAIQRSRHAAVEEGSASAEGVKSIAEADSDFEISTFLENAVTAYEMIFSAFGAGDREFLKDMLSPEVMEGFSEAISGREERHEKIDTDFVAVQPKKVVAAHLEGSHASITVEFVSQMINVVRNQAGDIVEGAADRIEEVRDVWTFSRDLQSGSPVWKLVSTEA